MLLRKNQVVVVLFVLTIFPLLSAAHAQSNGGVITTNYPKPGDTQPAPAIRLIPLPSYGDYSNMETDPTAITAAERDNALTRMRASLPNGIGIVSRNRWDEAQEGLRDVQIVNNVPIQGSTYTFYLPPGWAKSTKLPIILSGNGAGQSNNERVWKSVDTVLTTVIGQSGQPGRATPIIGAISNAGGTESQGIDEHSLKSVGAFFAFMAQNGGDPQRAITAGASRGGGTALLWAINPLNLPYTVQAVFADIPPTAYGTLSQRSVLTYPNLGYIYVAVTHIPNAYLYSSPVGPSKTGIKALIGTNDPAEADARSPLGLAEKLRGKTVVIGRGTHDAFFPFWEFIRFDRRLNELNIPHTTVITLSQGHSASASLLGTFETFVNGLSIGKPTAPPPGRFTFINTNPPGGTQVFLAAYLKDGAAAQNTALDTLSPSPTLPFTVEFPSHAGVGNPVDIALCGAPGTAYSYQAAAPDGSTWTKADGTFSAEECTQTTLPAPATPGEYVWSFTYGGKPIPAINTPLRNQGGCGLPATTIVTVDQPSPGEINGAEPSLGFGVDEYSAQDAACLAQ